MTSQLISRDERLAVIENLLFHSPDGVRAVDLAEACQVDRRTIYRDVAKLRANGVPLYKKSGRFYVSREYYTASVQLNVHETTALYTAVRVMAQLAEQQNPYAISALSKLSAALPDPLSDHVSWMAGILREKPIDRLFVRVVETLTRAWSEQRLVRLWYRQESDPIEFAPFFLEAVKNGSYFVVGKETKTQQVRAFRLSWVVRVELLPTRFQEQITSRRAYLADETGLIHDDASKSTTVKLAFNPDVAPLILRKRLNGIDETSTAPDGRTLITLHVDRWEHLQDWVRSLGKTVEVLAPDALREAIRKEAQFIVAMYKDDDSTDDRQDQHDLTVEQ